MLLFALPRTTWALAYPKLLPECTKKGDCNACDIIALFGNWSELIALGVIIPGAFLIAIGGLTWLISAGNPEKIQLGRKMIVGSIMGMVIVFLAYSIVNFSIAALTGQSDLTKVNVSADTRIAMFNTRWDQICKSGSSASAPVTSCDGQSNGRTCSVSGQCSGAACQCSNSVCVNACDATLASTGSAGSCMTDSACQTSGGSQTGGQIGGGPLCEANNICCNTGAATTAAETSTEVSDCEGQPAGTACDAAVLCSDSTDICQCDGSDGAECTSEASAAVSDCTGQPAGTTCNVAGECTDSTYCQCNASGTCTPACEVVNAPNALCVADEATCTATDPLAASETNPALCGSAEPVCCIL